MATDLENAVARKSAILLELASLTQALPGGRPDIRGGVGGAVAHTEYRLSLLKELELLNEIISVAQGPFEVSGRYCS